jgi:hypothetical protein
MNGTMVERFAKRDHRKNSGGNVTFPSYCEMLNKGKHVTDIDDIKIFLRTVVSYYNIGEYLSLEVFV